MCVCVCACAETDDDDEDDDTRREEESKSEQTAAGDYRIGENKALKQEKPSLIPITLLSFSSFLKFAAVLLRFACRFTVFPPYLVFHRSPACRAVHY